MTPAIAKTMALDEAITRLRNMPELKVEHSDDKLKVLSDTSQALGIELAIKVVLSYGLEIAQEEIEALKQ